jgi:hypothetical protein
MRFAPLIALAATLVWATPLMAADIADYFRMYYAQYVAPNPSNPPLDFLTGSAEQALATNAARKVIVDRANGYLRINDDSRTEQVLTMAVYLKADGNQLLVVGTSDCADACLFSVGFYAISGSRLQAIARDAVVPTIDPARFIKTGQAGPRNAPTISYVPAQVGTTLTLKPWYGYEVEETMNKATRASIHDVVLTWDRTSGRFH